MRAEAAEYCMDKEEFFSLLSFLQMSEYRQKIIKVLSQADRPMTPTDISEETEIHRDHVSRHLGKLKEKELVSVLNPDSRMHRYYKLTETGEELTEQMIEEGYLEQNSG